MKRFFSLFRVQFSLVSLFWLVFSQHFANAQSTLIPVTTRRDLVYDATRGMLYITTSTGTVERYDVATKTLLTPYTVGTALNGADITASGAYLYVAENQVSGTLGVIHKVNLSNGTATDVTYTRAFGEAGVWNVCIASNGTALVTTLFSGSGWVPLRQLTLASDTLATRTENGTVRQNSNLARGNDRKQIILTESNISSGPFFSYDASTDKLSARQQAETSMSGSRSAINRNSSLIAIELGNGISIVDPTFKSIENLPYNGGLIFDPVQDLIYAGDTGANEIVAVDTNTWKEKYRVPVGETISTSIPMDDGVMAISNDGKKLFISTTTGVRMIDLPSSTGVASSITLDEFPPFIPTGKAGNFRVTIKDPAGNLVTNYTGTVNFTSTDVAATLPGSYTFTAADGGTRTFSATMNTAGTQTLTVSQAGPPMTSTQPGIAVHAPGVSLIPLTNVRHHVFDPQRNFLYITTDTGYLYRYDVVNETLLWPWKIADNLNGADITPNGSHLLVCDARRGVIEGFVRQIDLSTGAVTKINYGLSSLEAGSWGIAITNDGRAIFTTQFAGSGWNPLHVLDLTTFGVTNLKNVRQDTHVHRGADRSVFFLAESNSSGTPIFTYSPASSSFPAQMNLSSGFNDGYLSAVSRDGKLISHEVGANLTIRDPSLTALAPLNLFDGGSIFDPNRDILYAVNTTTDELIAFDTNTWAQSFKLPIGEDLSGSSPFGSGVMSIHYNSSLIFLSTPTGVRIFVSPLGSANPPPPPPLPSVTPPVLPPPPGGGGGGGGGTEGNYPGSSGLGNGAGGEGTFGFGRMLTPAFKGPFQVTPNSYRVFNVSHQKKADTPDRQGGIGVLGWGLLILAVFAPAALVLGRRRPA